MQSDEKNDDDPDNRMLLQNVSDRQGECGKVEQRKWYTADLCSAATRGSRILTNVGGPGVVEHLFQKCAKFSHLRTDQLYLQRALWIMPGILESVKQDVSIDNVNSMQIALPFTESRLCCLDLPNRSHGSQIPRKLCFWEK